MIHTSIQKEQLEKAKKKHKKKKGVNKYTMALASPKGMC